MGARGILAMCDSSEGKQPRQGSDCGYLPRHSEPARRNDIALDLRGPAGD